MDTPLLSNADDLKWIYKNFHCTVANFIQNSVKTFHSIKLFLQTNTTFS